MLERNSFPRIMAHILTAIWPHIFALCPIIPRVKKCTRYVSWARVYFNFPPRDSPFQSPNAAKKIEMERSFAEKGHEGRALRIQIRDVGAHISYEFQREQKWITLLHLGKCPKRTCSTLECSNRLQDVPLCGTRLAIHKCEGHNSNSGKNEGAEKEGLRRCGTRWNIIRVTRLFLSLLNPVRIDFLGS